MRFLTRKLHRAFPELDSFDDLRCARFVRAARGGLFRSLIRGTLVIGTGLTLLTGLLILTDYLLSNVFRIQMTFGGRQTFIWIASTFLAGTLSLCAALLLRDWLIRRRIARVLRAGARCSDCQYPLLGLPVTPDSAVDCPECGMHMRVDPSFAELVTDADGQVRLKPKPEKRLLPLWMNRQFAWRMGKYAMLCFVLAIFGGAGWWGWREYALGEQAKLAASERVGLDVIIAIQKELNPPDDGSEDAWEIFKRIDSLLIQSETEISSAPDALKNKDGQVAQITYDLVFSPVEPDPEGPMRDAKEEAEMARRAMRRFAELGGLAEVDRLTRAKRAVQTWNLPPGQPGIMVLMPWLSRMRVQARMNCAFMHTAYEARNLEQYLAALRANLAIARMAERQPLMINRLVAHAIEALTEAQLTRHITRGLPPGWAPRIDAAFKELPPGTVPVARTLEGEQSWALDTVAWYFTDVARVRIGDMRALSGGYAFGRVGTYIENRDEINRQYARLIEEFQKPRPQQSLAWLGQTPRLPLVETLFPAFEKFGRSLTQITTTRTAVLTLLAIECYKDRTGDYPSSLADLIPTELSALPVEAFTLTPLRYKRIDPALEPQKRSYLLYAIGFDGVDNNANMPPGDKFKDEVLWKDSYKGYDLIFNDLNR